VINVPGMYEDRLTRVGGHWLLSSRKVTQDTLPPSALPHRK